MGVVIHEPRASERISSERDIRDRIEARKRRLARRLDKFNYPD